MNFLNFFCTWLSFRPNSSKSSFFELFLQKNSKSKIPKKFKKFIFRTFSKKNFNIEIAKKFKKFNFGTFFYKKLQSKYTKQFKKFILESRFAHAFFQGQKVHKSSKSSKNELFFKNFQKFSADRRSAKSSYSPPPCYGEVRGWFWGVFWVILGVPRARFPVLGLKIENF